MRIFIFCTTESVFHPTMFYRLLKKHRELFGGAAICPGLKSTGLAKTMAKAFRVDGARCLPRATWRYARHFFRCRFGSTPTYSSIYQVLNEFNLPIFRFNSPNDASVESLIKAHEVDVIFNNQPRLLRAPVLNAARLLCMNRHTSLLPRYRGIEPVFHAMREGESEIGVTLHSMTEEYDAGRILAQIKFTASSSVFDCYQSAFDLTPILFDEAIANIRNAVSLGSVETTATRIYKQPTVREIKQFKDLGRTYF